MPGSWTALALVAAGVFAACGGGGGASSPAGTGAQGPRAPAPPGGRFGAAAPTVIQDVSPAGSFVVACQALRDTDGDGRLGLHFGHHGEVGGDDLTAFLFTGGRAERITGYAGRDPAGRFVAFQVGGALFLEDTFGGRRVRLGSAALRDTPFGQRGLRFSPDGRHLVYFEKGNDEVRVRELATGREVALEADHPVFDAWVAGPLVGVLTVPSDSNRDGAREPPEVDTTLADSHCRGPIMSYSVGDGEEGDAAEWAWARIDSGDFEEVGEILALRPWGVLAIEDGKLAIVRPDGRVEELASRCDLEDIAVAPTTEAIVYRCDDQAYHLRAGSRHERVPFTFESLQGRAVTDERFPHLVFQDRVVWFDLESGAVRTLRLPGGAFAFSGVLDGVAFGQRNGRLTLLDFATGRGVDVDLESDDDIRVLDIAGDFVLAGANAQSAIVLDLRHRRSIGTAPASALAVSAQGRVLTGGMRGWEAVTGPLEWRAPGSGD